LEENLLYKATRPSKKASFVKGAVILSIAGIICKIIGVVYRIPLTNIIGENGFAYYAVAFDIYNVLLVLSAAGLPVAISKMVSERTALGDHLGARKVFRTAAAILAILGFVFTVLMIALSGPIAQGINSDMQGLWQTILWTAPALFFVCLISAYRGFFQGMQVMMPTAVSQVVEQVARLAVGLPMAAWLFTLGGDAAGANGAVIGTTISEAIALVILAGIYLAARPRLKKRIDYQMTNAPIKQMRTRSILKKLAKLAIPVTLGACIMPLVQFIDTAMVMNVLNGIPELGPYSKGLYGILKGSVNPLINLPSVITLSLMMTLVPAISSSLAHKDFLMIRKKAGAGLKLAIISGLPFAVMFIIMARPILSMLFGTLNDSQYMNGLNALDIGTLLLQILGGGIFFISIIQTLTGVLQGMGRMMTPVINLAIGAAVKIALTYLLVRIPSLNIQGAAISTVACYVVAAILNIIFTVKHTQMQFRLLDYIVKPVIATAVMGAFMYFGQGLLSHYIGMEISAIIIMVIGAAIYLLLTLVLGVLKQEDMEFIPGGRKLQKLMKKISLKKQ
jgi:stage V sporulation protein B